MSLLLVGAAYVKGHLSSLFPSAAVPFSELPYLGKKQCLSVPLHQRNVCLHVVFFSCERILADRPSNKKRERCFK